MKVRHIKKRTMRMMDTRPWSHDENPPMFYIRKVKACKSYSPWCADCNGKRFFTQYGRFPHTLDEFDIYNWAINEQANIDAGYVRNTEGFLVREEA